MILEKIISTEGSLDWILEERGRGYKMKRLSYTKNSVGKKADKTVQLPKFSSCNDSEGQIRSPERGWN